MRFLGEASRSRWPQPACRRRPQLGRQRPSARGQSGDDPVPAVTGIRARRSLLVGHRILEPERRPDIRCDRQRVLLRTLPEPDDHARLVRRPRAGHRERPRLCRLRPQRSSLPATRHPRCREHRAAGNRRQPPLPRPMGHARPHHRRLGPSREARHGPDLLAEPPGRTRPPCPHAQRTPTGADALLLRTGGTQQHGEVAAAALATPTVDVCVPPHSFADVQLTSSSDAHIPKAGVCQSRRAGSNR